MFICKNCGANMRFDPQTQKLTCSYCGTTVSPHEYKVIRALHAEEHKVPTEEQPYYQAEDAVSAQSRTDESSLPEEDTIATVSTYEATLMTCPQCGGQLLTTDETAATFCSFCGSSVLLESRVSNERRPDYIIPFQKTKEDCKKAYRKALKRALYAPSDMAEEEQIDQFRGIYMPYWVYSFKKNGPYETRGKKSHRRGDYIYTKHYRLTSQVDASYDGLSFDASSSFSDNLSEAIAPFEFSQAQPFEPAYLSGFYADTNDVDSSVYTEDARDIAVDHAANQLSHAPAYGRYNASVDNISLRAGNPRLAMYPVWFLSCRSKTGDRISYAVVNGQTGKVACDLPVDLKKMLIGTLVLALPIFLILNLLPALTPTKALIITMILGAIGMFLANRQMNRIHQSENRLDDKGYLYLKNPWGKKGKKRATIRTSSGGSAISSFAMMFILFAAIFIFAALGILDSGFFSIFMMIFIIVSILKPFISPIRVKRRRAKGSTALGSAPMRDKMKILWKPLAGIALAFLTIALAPVSDLYYYGVAVVAMVFIGWSFWDIFNLHNRLTTRPLPQFNKRGGEEYEHQS